MRLWHYNLIPYLPKEMLVSQWRECIAIKRQWEKGTLKHRLVSYIMNDEKLYFLSYTIKVINELENRNIKYDKKYYREIEKFCWEGKSFKENRLTYIEHNNRYLKQCYYNLQEKHDRGIINDEEWDLIERNINYED